MKKQLLLFVLMLLPIVASAEAVEIDEIYYNLISKGGSNVAKVTKKPSGYYNNSNIEIPEHIVYNNIEYTVTSIGEGAFLLCTELNTIILPNTITSINEDAFNACHNLSSITIPSNLTTIGNHAFQNCWHLSSIPIPNTVTTIGDYAFMGCTELTTMVIPNSVTSIGMLAFQTCRGLTSVTLSEKINGLNQGLFWGCNNLKSVTIPDDVTFINSDVFYGCANLESINIPAKITWIGKKAFEGCKKLSSVYITDLEAWCKLKFDDALSNPMGPASHLYLNNEEIIDFVIPNSITSINQFAFYGCNELTSVTIPHNVTSIDMNAFAGCNGLKSVHITDLESWCKISFLIYNSNPLSYAHHLFLNGEEITDLVIPNNITTIGDYTFYGCAGLKSVTIHNKVTSIGLCAFEECSNMTVVNIGSKVGSIEYKAFASCPEITDVYCFPVNVPSVYANTFYDPINVFLDSYIEYATLHVPITSIDAYQNTEPWKRFGKIIALTDSDPNSTSVEHVKSNVHDKDNYYTLSGQHVTKPQKGIFITNGKKVIVK